MDWLVGWLVGWFHFTKFMVLLSFVRLFAFQVFVRHNSCGSIKYGVWLSLWRLFIHFMLAFCLTITIICAARYNIYGYRFYSRHFIDNLFLDTHVQHINARRTDLIWFELKTSIRCRKLYQSQTFNPSQNFRHT